MAKYVYGIDLGTTYSCIAYVDKTGRANVINNLEGNNTTPSVVNFANNNQVIVGQVAKENAIIDPQNTMLLVKTLMGKSNFAINYNGEDKSPEEVSAYILRKIVNDASEMLDTEVNDVVITCPAYFGTAERTATKNAGKIAGLNVLELISEPTAAALYYGCTKEVEEKTILIYDLGGGTFDVTIMNINRDKIEVICSDGNPELGGKDWDDMIMRYVAEEFKTKTGFDEDFDEYAQQDLRLKVERAKKQLSSKDEVPILIDVAGIRAKVSLSREIFDKVTELLLNETLEKTDAVMEVAKAKGYVVEEILLVGGSTRMPQVTRSLVEKYGIKPKVLEPDEAVAKGAAIYAVNVYIDKQKNYKIVEEKNEILGESGESNEDTYDNHQPMEDTKDNVYIEEQKDLKENTQHDETKEDIKDDTYEKNEDKTNQKDEIDMISTQQLDEDEEITQDEKEICEENQEKNESTQENNEENDEKDVDSVILADEDIKSEKSQEETLNDDSQKVQEGMELDEFLARDEDENIQQSTEDEEKQFNEGEKEREEDKQKELERNMVSVLQRTNDEQYYEHVTSNDEKEFNDDSRDTEDEKELFQEKLEVDTSLLRIGGQLQKVIVAATKSFAIEVIYEDREICYNMIIKNSPMPEGKLTVSRTFGVYEDNMRTAEIVVYENDFMEETFEIDKDYVLGTVALELPGDLPKGAPIEIAFTLNKEGILEVMAKDLTSDKMVHATMRSKGIMADELVEELIRRARNVEVL